ncbi:hypothetical protein MXM49_26040, partial [Klebsiella quasipneumoniae]|nr:hypothetical protein [Klebsiella quasipneumoniae]
SEQRDTASADQSEQVIRHLKQEIEHLNTLLLSKDSHIDSLKQDLLWLNGVNFRAMHLRAYSCMP